jgi:hypothetical protein
MTSASPITSAAIGVVISQAKRWINLDEACGGIVSGLA